MLIDEKMRTLILTILFLIAISVFAADTPAEDDQQNVDTAVEQIGPIGFVVPPAIERGGVLRGFIVVPDSVSVASISVRLARSDGYEVGTHAWRVGAADYQGEVWQLLIGIDHGLAPGPALIYAAVTFVDGRTLVLENTIHIDMRQFREEEIALSYALTTLRTSDDEQRASEARELWSILQTTDLEARYHLGRFIEPLQQYRRTSFFGDRRRYRYIDGTRVPSLHNGLDMAAPLGTLIAAPGRGLVVMAQERIVSGNTVVIEHQPGVYSLHYHLDRIDVEAGDFVEQGDIIGTVGSTGLSTGPHLHWEVRVSGVPVDPEWFVNAPLVDTRGVAGALSPIP